MERSIASEGTWRTERLWLRSTSRNHMGGGGGYPDAPSHWNYVSSMGSYISAISTLAFFLGVARAFARREQAADDPWGEGAGSLEWTLSSSPPFHCFETLPRIGNDERH